jgi:hypothetical protein
MMFFSAVILAALVVGAGINRRESQEKSKAALDKALDAYFIWGPKERK